MKGLKNIDLIYLCDKEYIERLKNKKKPALFIDRDGVLLEEKHYLSDPEQVVLEKGVKKLLRSAYSLELPVIIITNQSGISRNYFTWEDYKKVTDKMLFLVGKDSPIIAIYANSDNPNKITTNWRKPLPGMFFQAKDDFNIDLKQSILIGDRLSDLKAGANAGLNILIHLLTGHGFKERDSIEKSIQNNNLFNINQEKSKIYFLDTLEDVVLSKYIGSY